MVQVPVFHIVLKKIVIWGGKKSLAFWDLFVNRNAQEKSALQINQCFGSANLIICIRIHLRMRLCLDPDPGKKINNKIFQKELVKNFYKWKSKFSRNLRIETKCSKRFFLFLDFSLSIFIRIQEALIMRIRIRIQSTDRILKNLLG